jgi:hypothetical protein
MRALMMLAEGRVRNRGVMANAENGWQVMQQSSGRNEIDMTTSTVDQLFIRAAIEYL